MPTISPARPVKEERFVPGIHSVQGINSRIEDIKLRGEQFIAVLNGSIVDATLKRKIVGASELTLTILDDSPNRRLLRSELLEEAHELVLDRLRWKLVKVSSEGITEPLTLTYEPRVVYDLKHIFGPHKAFRDTTTRAEYAQARAYEARPRPKFIAPELHVVQEIGKATATEAKEREQKAKEERRKGIGVNPGNLKVATRPATKEQTNILNRMLEVAESMGANTKVMEALVVTCIDESFVGALDSNLMQQEPFTNPGDDDTNPEDSARGFLEGWNGGPGAIEFNRANPGASVAEICTYVQKNRDGATPYERFLGEGREWVEAYGGGLDVTTRDFSRFAFQQAKEESNWRCMVRLATQVRWRCFESAGWIYFLDDATLLRSPKRMMVSDTAPGIIDTTFDYDIGKEVQEVTVEALAKTWAAPPGSVAKVTRHGPADGLYLVNTIESKPSSAKQTVNVVLRKPLEELPEPAPKERTGSVSIGGTGGASSGKLSGINITSISSGAPYWGGSAALFKQFFHPFMEDRGLSPGGEKEQGHAPGGDHDPEGQPRGYATDYPTTSGRQISIELAAAMGHAGWEPGTYEPLVIEVDGYRFACQILWEVPDHYDHIHVGAHRI